MLLFALEPQDPLAEALAHQLGCPIGAHEERAFPDGEQALKPLVDPRGADAYVVCSLHDGPHASVHDKLCRLLMFASGLRVHGAARVSAVVPYLAYARMDEHHEAFEALGLRCVAQLIEAAGIGQVIVLEPHNVAAFQNAFRCTATNLAAHPAFTPVARELGADAPIVVAAPDPGGIKRAQRWRDALEAALGRPVGFAMVDKRRSGGVVSGGQLVAGDVSGAAVLLLDDLIASGETIQHAAAALRRAGADRVVACAAHGLFVADASQRLADDAIDDIVVSDSVPPFRLAAGRARSKLRTESAAPLFAAAIRASHAAWPEARR